MGGLSQASHRSYQRTYREHVNTQQGYQSTLAQKRVFISFHIDDEPQVQLIREQAKSDRFDLEFVDYSVKEPFDEKWKTQCEERIKQSSVFVVAIGKDTHSRPAVLWEIETAYKLGKKVIGVRIYRDKNHKIPEPMIRNKTKIINWDIKDLQREIDNAER